MGTITLEKTDGRHDLSSRGESEVVGAGINPAQPEELAARLGFGPSNSAMKALLKAPLLAWRLGLGRILGRRLMIMTSKGRKSGLSRRTAVEFYEHNGRKYVFSLRGTNTDWYRNLAADPHMTIQTAEGTEQVKARRVTENREVGEAYDFLAAIPVMKQWAAALGIPFSRESVIANKDRFILVSFDPTTDPTPPPLKPDLGWIWPAAEGAALLGWLVVRNARKRAAHRATTALPTSS